MSKKRFLLGLSLMAILLISLAISSFSANAPLLKGEAANDFYLRHPSWTGSALQLSAGYHLDCFRRELHLKVPALLDEDASNYYMNVS